jgi:hypothetical protein
MEKNLCPVRGYALRDPPWSDAGPSDEICPSCGIHFGFDDVTAGIGGDPSNVYDEWRERWLSSGPTWWSTSRSVPAGWDPREQLARIGKEG